MRNGTNLSKKTIIIVIVSIIAFIIFIFLMPIILNKIYYSETKIEFLIVGYTISDIINYYGAILTFLGTVGLGAITIYQNYIAQKKTEEVNKLTLELQKKSMALAERNFEKEKQIDNSKIYPNPKFELRNVGCSGRYKYINAVLKNVSLNMVSSIKSISFEVLDVNKETIMVSKNKVISQLLSLAPGQQTDINFYNEELITGKTIYDHGQSVPESMKEITLVWSFQCEDAYSNIHYFKATVFIEDSSKFNGDIWNVAKVG